MSTFEILSLAIGALSIPIWGSLMERLGVTNRKRLELMQNAQILANLPKGDERDQWEKIVQEQSREVRLTAGFDRILGNLILMIVGLVFIILLIIWAISSDDFMQSFKEANLLFQAIPLVVFFGYAVMILSYTPKSLKYWQSKVLGLIREKPTHE